MSDVALEPGVNHLRVRASVTTTGAVDLAGTISGAGLGQARFDQAVTIRRPRALLLSNDPAGTEAHLQKTLESSQFEVQLAAQVPDRFDDYQLVIFNNWDMESVPAARKQHWKSSCRKAAGCCGSRASATYMWRTSGPKIRWTAPFPPSSRRRGRPKVRA